MKELNENVKALRLILHYEGYMRFTAREASEWYTKAYPSIFHSKKSRGRWLVRLLPKISHGEPAMQEIIDELVQSGHLGDLGLTSFTNKPLHRKPEREYKLTELAMDYKRSHKR